MTSNAVEKEAIIEQHYKYERKTVGQILVLECAFRQHHELVLQELHVQSTIVGRMWILSNRYLMLISTGDCCKYPEIYSKPTQDVILSEYHDKLQALRASNKNIMSSLEELQKSVGQFEQYYSKLDMSVSSPVILGDVFHKPIEYFIELISDLLSYMHSMCVRINVQSHRLEPEDITMLEEYKTLLKPSEEFEEYLQKGLVYCKCFETHPVCFKA